MKESFRFALKSMLEVAVCTGGLALLFVGWVALLSFPWDWVVPAGAVLEALAVLLVLKLELSARSVNGAAGWMTFGFVLGHAWLFAGAAVLRVVVLLGQWLFG